MADRARTAALGLLAGVLEAGASLADQAEALAGLSAPERARAQRLAAGVLRQSAQLDRALLPLLKKAPPPPIVLILRLALFELIAGEAAHGVVHEAVEAARRVNPAFAGLVNAVLRRVDPKAVKGDQRLPAWLREALISAHGRRAVEAMERVFSRTPPLDLTLRAPEDAALFDLSAAAEPPVASPADTRPPAAPTDVSTEARAETAPVAATPSEATPTEKRPPRATLLPTGTLRLAPGVQLSALPGYAEGRFWVQDAAAALAVKLLGDVKGLRVLDLCAAPGGKTLQLAAAGAEVTALDISGPRLQRLEENLARTNLSAQIVTADALHWQPEAPFDAILLDAPCSATGTIRRHPDLPFLRQSRDVAELAALQSRLATRARGWLKPGGRLVFATCSLLPEEGEHQVAHLVGQGMRTLKPEIPGVEAAWWGPHGLRLRPDLWEKLGGMDGFFIACLAEG